MPTSHPYQEAKPLSYFVTHLAELPDWSWLYIAADASEILSDTICHPTATPSCDMSDEEIEAFEAYAECAGLRSFFCRDQLQQIADNLTGQCSTFTQKQLVTAINFYWRHDAFIDLSAHAA
ncbi:MAG: hypothetical protein WA956_08690 [Stenotrophomonas sp.]